MKNELDRLNMDEIQDMMEVIDFLRKFQDFDSNFKIDVEDNELIVSRIFTEDEQRIFDMGYSDGFSDAKDRYISETKSSLEVGDCHCNKFRDYSETNPIDFYEYCPFCGLKNINFIP